MGTAQDNVGLVITCPWDSQTGNRMKTAIWEEGKMKKAMCGSGGASLLLLSLQELQETERFSRKAAQAARDLTRAEAEIELLQDLLRDKEEQVSAGTLRPPPEWVLVSFLKD